MTQTQYVPQPVLSQQPTGGTKYYETTYLPSQNVAKSTPGWENQSGYFGSTTGMETTFLPTQSVPNYQTPRPTTSTIVQGNLEPIVHKETQRVYEQPIYIQQRPVIHEKTLIIEKPIITEKTIIEKEINIIREMPELHETSYHQTMQPVTIREKAIVSREDVTTNFSNLQLEGEPILTQQTELQRDAPIYMKEQTDLYVKEIVHQRPIIHEKDIFFVERPVIVERPEIVERPILRQEEPYVVKEPIVRREMVSDESIPEEALVHSERVVVQEVPMFVKERPEVYEREVIHEKRIIHDQPVIYSEKQEIHEKPEFIEKRSYRVEQAGMEKGETVVYRTDSPTTRVSSTTNQNVEKQSNLKPMSDVA